MAEPIESLGALIAAQQWNEALVFALGWWRRTRAAELAQLIDWLGERADTPELKAHGAPAEAFQTVWRERLGTLGPSALKVLLPTLLTKVPERREGYYILSAEDYRRWHSALFERLQALTEVPPDPRIAQRLAKLIARSSRSSACGGRATPTCTSPSSPRRRWSRSRRAR